MAKYHAKLKGIETLDAAFAVLDREYALGTTLPQQFVQSLATIAPTWHEGLTAVVRCADSYTMRPDEEMLRRLVVKTTKVSDMLEVTTAFRRAFPDAVLNQRIMRVCLGRVRSVKDPYGVFERLAHDLGVEPDKYAYAHLLIQVLKSAVLDERKICNIRSIIEKLERSDFDVVHRIKSGKNLGFGMDPHHARFLYMRYLFLERRHQEALQLLPLVLKAKGLSPRAQHAVAMMVNMFLPVEHPYRAAIAAAVPNQSTGSAQEATFRDAFRAWVDEDNAAGRARFDGGTVFRPEGMRPINKSAVREFFKKPRE